MPSLADCDIGCSLASDMSPLTTCLPRRTVPRWQLQEATPARTLRQGSYKQQLRQREEANLELVRGGGGGTGRAVELELGRGLLGSAAHWSRADV